MELLAEYLHGHGAHLFGSDVAEVFYTDAILKELGVPFAEGFAAENLRDDTDLVVYSAAYDPDTHPEIVAAAHRGLPIMEYTQALGAISARRDATGISGTHGKTTTTAMVGSILIAGSLPASILVASAVSIFGDRSVAIRGEKYLVAETCEYRRHFHRFHPDRIVITSIEPDHLDYFTGMEDVLDAFVAYIHRLSRGGVCIYCADDRGATEAVNRAAAERPDIRMVPYGFSMDGEYGITRLSSPDGPAGRNRFRIRGVEGDIELRVPGRHSVLNATAAAAVARELYRTEADSGVETSPPESFEPVDVDRTIREGLFAFTGCRRRSELVGTAGGVVVVDDYGHHPTEIRTTLAGYREFYPGRRMIVSFMSHTYTRTGALLGEFAESFSAADIVILHKIYASAREKAGGVTGRDLLDRVRTAASRDGRPDTVLYYDEPDDALEYCLDTCTDGDLFVTMGAGSNWTLGRALLDRLERRGRDPHGSSGGVST